MRRRTVAIGIVVLVLAAGAVTVSRFLAPALNGRDVSPAHVSVTDTASPDAHRLAAAAAAQVGVTTEYDAAYVQLDYPGGDVPVNTGACTDVVVRAFRELEIDLQVEVHEDMTQAFDSYPHRWGLSRPDPNIDHRRVPNLGVLFERRGIALPITANGQDYQPGDVVTWSVGGKSHIGIVTARVTNSGDRFCIAHNIGRGTRENDFLFDHPITGHYRWFD